jgi:predicted RNA-binding protein YlqC (UPF0109 family)
MTDLARTKQLLRDLVAAFTIHPEAIQIDATPGGQWVMKGARHEDEPVLVGKHGSHVRALSFLVRAIGEARGESYSLKLITTHEPRDRVTKKKIAETHDPAPAAELLGRILAELSIGDYMVETEQGQTVDMLLAFNLTIRVRQFADYNALTVAPGSTSPVVVTSETLVGALGTLFRAIAKKIGVRYDLVVARERPVAS